MFLSSSGLDDVTATSVRVGAGERPRHRQDLETRAVDGEIVALDRTSGLIHQLNQTASFVWTRCTGALTLADIAAQLSGAFDVSPDRAARDVAAIVVRFHLLDLLQRVADDVTRDPA
jgi:hypothetical protein